MTADTPSPAILNLDLLAAQHAQQIITRTKKIKAEDVDNMITKTLGVLQENGLYACSLFLLARKPKEPHARVILDELYNLLQAMGWGKPDNKQSATILQHLSDKVLTNLADTLLAKDIAEQTLIYARYGAKARSADPKPPGAKDEEE